MLSQLTVGLVQGNLIPTMLVHTGFQIVTPDNPCDTAEIFARVDMGSCPAFLIHGEECFHIAVAAVWQCGNENICRDNLACVRIDDGSCIACPVDLHDFTGLVMQVHGGVGFGNVIAVILVELCGLIRKLAGIAAGFTVFQPQQVQRNTVLLQFSVDVIVVRHLVYRLC